MKEISLGKLGGLRVGSVPPAARTEWYRGGLARLLQGSSVRGREASEDGDLLRLPFLQIAMVRSFCRR